MNVRGRTFLVTGGAGFIGSYTADALIARGARVVIVDNLVTGRRENVNPQAVFYPVDCASKRLEKIFAKEKPHYVYHFAFNVLVPQSVENPIMDAQSIIASLWVIENCRRFGVKKIIFSSSGFLYGNRAQRPADERQPIEPISPYVVSKHAVENYLEYYRKSFGLPYVILRYSTVYGPRQVRGALADYLRQLRRGKQAKIWGDGSKTRDYVFIEDVVKANLLVLNLPADYRHPLFNLGTGRETALNTVYRTVARLLKRPAQPIYLPDRPAEQIRYSLDHAKIRKALGWHPVISLQEGLRRIIAR